MRCSLKHGRSSSSLDCFQPYLKKQRVEMLSFCSSSVISGKQTRVSPPLNSKLETPPLTKTPEINGLIENKYCRVRSCCSDDDDDDKSAVSSSPAQSDSSTEKQNSNLGSSSDDVSESKSVRVERLKKRFSRIIVKSAQLQEKVDRSNYDLKLDDSVKMQIDKQILIERKKLKEAQIAADSAKLLVEKHILLEKKMLKEAQIAAEAESKMELQRKREAARKALLELERTVEVNDNIKTMKDFAVLLGYPRNSAACNRKEIGWYGDWVVYWKRTKDEGGALEELFKERGRRMRLSCLNMYR